MKLRLLLVGVVLALAGCGGDKSDLGYSDGYAAGYNTTCKIRATLVEGDWENKSYKTAYDQGYSAGTAACYADGR